MTNKITAKEFFLQLGAMVALYAGAVALLNLLFRVIDRAFPPVNQYYGYGYMSNPISFPVATLIVVFPLFLVLSWVIQKNYSIEPSLRESALRKWLLYVTLFVAGGIIAGDLISLIYRFLDGQELTWGFLLKVLSVLVVAGGVFGYYLSDLRERLTRKNRNVWRIFSILLVLGSIVLGFVVIGSPASQRALRYDSDRISHLEGIQWQVLNYWQQKEVLPNSLAELQDPLSGWTTPMDPKTEAAYEYKKTGSLSFQLCATFERPGPQRFVGGVSRPMPMMDSAVGIKGSSNWEHEAGRACFDRTIDPDLYPPRRPL